MITGGLKTSESSVEIKFLQNLTGNGVLLLLSNYKVDMFQQCSVSGKYKCN